jgi:hypothetical protein
MDKNPFDINYRTRQCNNPVPQVGGADCVGSCYELSNCLALKPCTNEGGESIDGAMNSLRDKNGIDHWFHMNQVKKKAHSEIQNKYVNNEMVLFKLVPCWPNYATSMT